MTEMEPRSLAERQLERLTQAEEQVDSEKESHFAQQVGSPATQQLESHVEQQRVSQGELPLRTLESNQD